MADPSPAPDLDRGGHVAHKAELRRELRAVRQAFVTGLGDARAGLEQALGPCLLERLGDAGTVAFTRAVGFELDPAPALAVFAAAGYVTALPAIMPDEGRLAFHAWRPGDPLRSGPHGIAEPDRPAPVHPHVVILPLLGFDRRGGRLGQGGGYYDRTLMLMPGTRRVGLAWSCQELKAVPADPWDVPLDAVLTEREWISMPQVARR